MKTVGNRIKKLRTERCLSTSALAEIIGISESEMIDIENGNIPNFKIGNQLADFFGQSLIYAEDLKEDEC